MMYISLLNVENNFTRFDFHETVTHHGAYVYLLVRKKGGRLEVMSIVSNSHAIETNLDYRRKVCVN